MCLSSLDLKAPHHIHNVGNWNTDPHKAGKDFHNFIRFLLTMIRWEKVELKKKVSFGGEIN